jgi:hypothetical protein
MSANVATSAQGNRLAISRLAPRLLPVIAAANCFSLDPPMGVLR